MVLQCRGVDYRLFMWSVAFCIFIAESNSTYCDRCYYSVVCPSVCLSVALVHPAKAVGQNEMPLAMDTRVVPSNIVLNGGPDPHEMGRFVGSEPPVHVDAIYRQITLALVTFNIQVLTCLLQQLFIVCCD